jgi:hypothetical protein
LTSIKANWVADFSPRSSAAMAHGRELFKKIVFRQSFEMADARHDPTAAQGAAGRRPSAF